MTTLKLTKVKFEGQAVLIPLDELVEDVPVDLRRVEELAGLIEKNGLLSPINVRQECKRIMDGFHRSAAVRLLGENCIPGLLLSCDEETFWSNRISNAVTHKSVSFARVVTWVRIAFANTKWAQMMGVEEAFRVGRRGAAISVALPPDEREALTAWVKAKSTEWKLDPQRIASMLHIAQTVNQELVKQVRDEEAPGVLTSNMLLLVGKRIPIGNLQQAIVLKVGTEKLSRRDTEILVDQVAKAKTDSQRWKLIYTPVHRTTRGRPSQHAVVELQKVQAGIVGDALKQLVAYMPSLSQPQPFDSNASEAVAVIARYVGQEDATALEILQKENQTLKGDITKLSRDLEDTTRISEMRQARVRELEEWLGRSR